MAFEKIVGFLKALADETRLSIVDFIKTGPKESIEIQDALGKSQSTVSQHLKILVEQAILEYEQKKIRKFYKIKDPQVTKIILMIQGYLAKQSKEDIKDMQEFTISSTLD